MTGHKERTWADFLFVLCCYANFEGDEERKLNFFNICNNMSSPSFLLFDENMGGILISNASRGKGMEFQIVLRAFNTDI